VRANRRFAIALALSIAAHLAFFIVPMRKPIDATILGSATPAPMTVTITEAQPPAQTAEAVVVEAAPAPQPVPRPAPRHRPVPITPVVPVEKPKGLEPVVPPPPPEPRSPPLVDMAAMIEARRAQRRAAEAQAARGGGTGQEPSANELAMATINRNLNATTPGEGVGGVFQILRKGTRTAEFAFNGWRPDTERRWREVIEVDAGQGGDVERAIVKRMIELIRGHYSGDFRWESRNLGRIVVLSARPEDEVGLEDFLIREFFGTPTLHEP
jgi:hypothetical protein